PGLSGRCRFESCSRLSLMYTELDAVNRILATIGESPVNSLDKATTSDAINALNRLRDSSRETQADAYWTFDTDKDVTLDLQGVGLLTLPPNTLKAEVDLSKTSTNIDPVFRGLQVYDRKNKTFAFSAPLVLSRISYLLPFDELPPTAQWYITIKAARVFSE